MDLDRRWPRVACRHARVACVASRLLACGLAISGIAHAGQGFQREVEPNNSVATANAIVGNSAALLANLRPGSDVDVFSFTASAGDRVYAATVTSAAVVGPGGITNTLLEVVASNGTTVFESDDDDGSFTTNASSIAGMTVPFNGTFYLRVTAVPTNLQVRPYQLQFQLRRGAVVAESEPNDFGTPQSLPASGWASGTILAGDVDAYRIALNAGDTVVAGLDLDPSVSGTGWDGRLGITARDGALPIARVSNLGVTGRPSEALSWTVTQAGVYDVLVDAASGAGPTALYNLSVTVRPDVPASSTCTTYTNTDQVTIPTGPDLVSKPILVPGHPRIADVDVSIDLSHANLTDLDVTLVSPAGNENRLFTDLTGSTTMSVRFDDEAAVAPLGSAPTIGIYNGIALQPEAPNRLAWFDGEDGGGTWTLNVRDDAAGNGGTLGAWSLTLCEVPSPCPGNTTPVPFYAQDFEASDGGFLATGTNVDWQHGTPLFAPIDSCNSGTACWKTSLADFYSAGSNEELTSPPLSLQGHTGTLIASWAQKYQMRDSTQDQIYVEVRQQTGANPRRLFEHDDGNMQDTVGNPATQLDESAGWAVRNADISAYAGQFIVLAYHLTSAAVGPITHAGFAIDDVVLAQCPAPPDALFANGFE